MLKAPRSLTGQYRQRQEAASRSRPRRHKPDAEDRPSHLRRRDRQQPQGRRSGDPVGPVHLRHRRVRFGQVDADQRHAVSRSRANELNGASHTPAPHREYENIELWDKVVDIDQSPIGRTPRSNPATYTGLFTPLRELFAQVPEARARGYSPGRFSFNVRGGRCEACQGDGLIKVEMHFLPDVYVPCDVCHGKRYNRETLEILYKGYNINDVLEMTVEDALDLFEAIPAISRKLETLMDVGLSYIKLGPERDHAVRRRGAAREAVEGTVAARHRAHAVHPRRTDHRPAFPRHRAPADGAAPACATTATPWW